jgi:hypothetical protein
MCWRRLRPSKWTLWAFFEAKVACMGECLWISANVGFILGHHLIRHVVVSLDDIPTLAIHWSCRILFVDASPNNLFSCISHWITSPSSIGRSEFFIGIWERSDVHVVFIFGRLGRIMNIWIIIDRFLTLIYETRDIPGNLRSLLGSLLCLLDSRMLPLE